MAKRTKTKTTRQAEAFPMPAPGLLAAMYRRMAEASIAHMEGRPYVEQPEAPEPAEARPQPAA